MPLALLKVRGLLPKTTPAMAEELPARETIDAPEVVAERSSTASLAKLTPAELAIEPLPDRTSVPPLMVLLPV